MQTEPRSYHYDAFMSTLSTHYDQRGCEVDFEIGADGSVIWTYDIRPQGEAYFLKVIPDDTYPEWQDGLAGTFEQKPTVLDFDSFAGWIAVGEPCFRV